MAQALKVDIKEIEVGPHFLTIYGEERVDLFELAKRFKTRFEELRPELADIQQKDLAHERYDPRVYHPYGHPTAIPKQNRPLHDTHVHFHIRYAYRPTENDIEQVKDILKELKALSVDTAKLTNLEDQKAYDWNYPEIPEGSHADYLAWINDIRANKYGSKVE